MRSCDSAARSALVWASIRVSSDTAVFSTVRCSRFSRCGLPTARKPPVRRPSRSDCTAIWSFSTERVALTGVDRSRKRSSSVASQAPRRSAPAGAACCTVPPASSSRAQPSSRSASRRSSPAAPEATAARVRSCWADEVRVTSACWSAASASQTLRPTATNAVCSGTCSSGSPAGRGRVDQRGRHLGVLHPDPEPQADHPDLDQPLHVGRGLLGQRRPPAAGSSHMPTDSSSSPPSRYGRGVGQLAGVHPADLPLPVAGVGERGEAERGLAEQRGEGDRHALPPERSTSVAIDIVPHPGAPVDP